MKSQLLFLNLEKMAVCLLSKLSTIALSTFSLQAAAARPCEPQERKSCEPGYPPSDVSYVAEFVSHAAASMLARVHLLTPTPLHVSMFLVR